MSRQDASWGAGPWDEEPDAEQWHWCGFVLVVSRGPWGAWCGYVGIPTPSPAELELGEAYADGDVPEITYAGEEPPWWDPSAVTPEQRPRWWLGFDCSHYQDFLPAMPDRGVPLAEYRTIADARGLAEALARAVRGAL